MTLAASGSTSGRPRRLQEDAPAPERSGSLTARRTQERADEGEAVASGPRGSPAYADPAAAAADGRPRARYLPRIERTEALRRAEANGALAVSVDFGAAAECTQTRGTLADLAETVDESIERALGARGAAGGPRVGDPASRLGNQLHRMRSLGAALLCLSFENLDATLRERDVAALRFWLSAAENRPVELLLDPADAPAALPLAPESPEERNVQADVAASPVQGAVLARVAAPGPETQPEPDERWRRWMLELYAARGPQSLASFERLFTGSYMPLVSALAAGLDAPKAAQVAAEFRRTFARMYTEVCPTFALTGKRPRMVFDAWEHAGRVARLHGARTTHLLLIDGMRWDLGKEIERLTMAALTKAGPEVQLADEQILWSAVPTTTPRQLATLAQGIDALRGETDGPESSEGEPVRGRTAEVVRRIKVGSRDLYKLDLVEARLGQVPLADLAAHASACLVRHVASLPPRTLLFVFGDHGFLRGDQGAFTHGGATPEEVLVASFSLMIGELH